MPIGILRARFCYVILATATAGSLVVSGMDQCKSEDAPNMSFLDQLIDSSVAPKQNEAHPAEGCCSELRSMKDNIAIS